MNRSNIKLIIIYFVMYTITFYFAGKLFKFKEWGIIECMSISFLTLIISSIFKKMLNK